MSIRDYFHLMKHATNYLISFIDNMSISEEHYQNLIRYIEDHRIRKERHVLKAFLHIIASICNNYKRSPAFFGKIEKIIFFLGSDIKRNFSNLEIFNVFKYNKRILLFLSENRLLRIDRIIYSKIENDYTLKQNCYIEYFLPEFQNFVNSDMLKKMPSDIVDFNIKRKNGENDNAICAIIRNDDINSFKQFVRKYSCSLNSEISSSIFETNEYLIKHKSRLIDYATFFGSFQIIKYLITQFAESTPYLWNYAVHGRNMEIIHLLEKCNTKPKDESVLTESIKCFHNEIALYLNHKFSATEDQNGQAFCFYGLEFYNFYFVDSKYISLSFFADSCKYDHYIVVEYLLSTKGIDVNHVAILNNLFFCK